RVLRAVRGLVPDAAMVVVAEGDDVASLADRVIALQGRNGRGQRQQAEPPVGPAVADQDPEPTALDRVRAGIQVLWPIAVAAVAARFSQDVLLGERATAGRAEEEARARFAAESWDLHRVRWARHAVLALGCGITQLATVLLPVLVLATLSRRALTSDLGVDE